MWRGRGLQGPGERVNVKDIIQSLSKDLPFHKVIFAPSEKETPKIVQEETRCCDWREPSARTITIMNEIFVKLFSDNKIDVDMIEKTLTLCPPDEDISTVEDRDHYNLLHKAIIFNDTSLVTVLLNHGIDINTSATNEECMNLSKARCPHANLGALHLACFLGCTDIVQILLRRGANKSLCRRVYTSAVVNAPLHKQPKQLNSNQLSKAIDIISKCGYREPVFYAVLGDHVEIVRILLGEQVMPPQKPDPKYRYLLHLACRVGAYQCLKYLLQLYPEEINSRDADGVPMLLMALNHDLKFMIVLLEHGADIHMLTDLWEPGSNVLHLLFQGLPLDGIQDTENISTVTELCLQRNVDVNSQRLPFKRTPLHDLLSVMNIPVAYDPFWKPQHLKKDIFREQTQFDDELFKCVQLLLKYGAKVNLMDSNNRTPLQILLSNGNHTLRCNMCLDERCPQNVKTAMATRSYGVENTIDTCVLLLQAGCQLSGCNPMRDFVEMMCSSYFGSDFWAWNHSLEILEIEPIFDSYMQLVKLQLQGGTNVNLCPRSQLPPLLYLLSHVADSPYADVYIVPMTTARRLSAMIKQLLKSGARTEVQIEVADNGVRSLSCFDMLTPVLHTLQQYHQQRSGKDLEILKELSLPLLQFGAKSIVFHKVLYDLPEGARTPWKYCLPTHSFFYQLLQFGLLNLHLVNDGHWYRELFEIFYSQSDHYTVQDALELIHDQMLDTHTNPCPCGQCELYQQLVKQVFRTPRTLKQLCRLSIHHSLGIRIGERINLLPLPSLLLNYLTSFKI